LESLTMNDGDIAARLEVGLGAIREAGPLAAQYFAARKELSIERKGIQDLVSIADREVEQVIRRHIGRAFPQDGIVGEEHGGELAQTLWIIDPIDGTANFLRGLPYWCVVLALAIDGEPYLSLTYDAVHDELFVARRGAGASCNGHPIQVLERSPAEACVGLSYSFKDDPGVYERLLHGLRESGLDHRRMGSSALSLCHVADGRLDAMAASSCNSWDVIAGLLLVQEAGGYATDYTEACGLLERRPVAAATGSLRAPLERVTGLRLRAAASRR
jgi:myo-inositol-1(or 4)-monophosphatase